MFQLDNYATIVERRCTDTNTHTHTLPCAHKPHSHHRGARSVHSPRRAQTSTTGTCPASPRQRSPNASATQARRASALPTATHSLPRDTEHKIHYPPAPSRAPQDNTVPRSGFRLVSHYLKTNRLCMCVSAEKSEPGSNSYCSHTEEWGQPPCKGFAY